MTADIFPKINRNEWKFVMWITILVILLTTIPFIYGYFSAPQGKYFTGLQALAPGDFNVYYSHIEQVRQGNWIFKDIFTSETHVAFFFNPFWLAVGLFAKIFKLSNIFTYQFFRIILTPIFLFTVYFFTSLFFQQIFKRKFCFIFLIFASGLGSWFSPLVKHIFGTGFSEHYWPMDLWVSEGQNFLTIYHSPHFIFASTLILITFILLYFSLEYNNFKYLFYAGTINLFLLFFHPFHLPTILTVPLVYISAVSFRDWRIKWDYLLKFIIFIFLSLPAILYQFLLLIFNPIAQGRASQNICLTPAIWIVLISYGFLTPLALYGVFKLKNNYDSKRIFLLVWFICQSLLIYCPLLFQRRIAQGLQFPLIIFSCYGLFYFAERFKKIKLFLENIEIFILFFIILFASSNIYVLSQDLNYYTYSKNKKYIDYFYINIENKQAFDWIKGNLDDQDIILTYSITGNYIPGFTGKTVYIGHPVETLKFDEKLLKVKEFFGGNQGITKEKEFLKQNKISYLFFGQYEQKIGNFNPQDKDYLKQVFHRGEVTIYQVGL